MVSSAALRLGAAHRLALDAGRDPNAARAAALVSVAQHLCEQLGLYAKHLEESRLARLCKGEECLPEISSVVGEYARLTDRSAHDRRAEAARLFGQTLDLLQASETSRERKKTGSYFTPSGVAEDLLARALLDEALSVRATAEGGGASISVCDPACGGGAFLVEAARQLSSKGRLLGGVVDHLYGVDRSEVALATTEVALWLLVGEEERPIGAPDRFVLGDALWGSSFLDAPVDDEALRKVEADLRLDFPRVFPHLVGAGFDWIVGNPPWVAFQGRATQKISVERRAFYRKHFRAFSGYPTLHGMFVERAVALAPHGHVTLLLPSSVSDLDGYKNARSSLRRSHTASTPLPEYGQDAFEGVVQPCFGLIARPEPDVAGDPERPWTLDEKSHAKSSIVRIEVPPALVRLDELPPLSKETFREVGFQSNRIVVKELFYRGDEPPPEFSVPLLEGRNVGEFVQRPPRLFLKPDVDVLKRAGVRLKAEESYRAVDVVVRQTAAFTIAARHHGARFRNSLIGAFGTEEISADLLVGLLNSALFRALHVMRQRDARQAAFPQVKVAHLRRLPAPPQDDELRRRIESVSRAASRVGGLDPTTRSNLDSTVFELFGASAQESHEILRFLDARAPGALRTHPQV